MSQAAIDVARTNERTSAFKSRIRKKRLKEKKKESFQVKTAYVNVR